MDEKEPKNRTPLAYRTLLLIGGILLLNVLGNLNIGDQPFYVKLDLTEEKRFSLTQPTREMIREVDKTILVQLLLDGDLPPGFERLQESMLDLLSQFRSENSRIDYMVLDPNEGTVEEINERREELRRFGVAPVTLSEVQADERSEKQIFPYAMVRYQERLIPVNLLENSNPGVNPEVPLNNSIALLEFKLAQAIRKAQRAEKQIVAFTTGRDELRPIETYDLERSLRTYYNTGRLHLDSLTVIPPEISVLVVAKPQKPFSETDLFKIDQYVMQGGKVIWMLDPAAVTLDSLQQRPEFYPVPYELGLDDLLFRYGVRLGYDLVLDIQASRIPLATGEMGGQAQFELFAYPYHVIALPEADHPIVKNLDPVNFLFTGRVDTSVRTRPALEKTVLLQSSSHSMIQTLPQGLSFEFLRYGLDPDRFDQAPQPLAVLLEGRFTSLFANRPLPLAPEELNAAASPFRAESPPNAMLVVADGDLAKNPFNPREQRPEPLGYNPYEQFTFANKDFLLNAIEYLLDPNGVIEARGKEVKLRLLDKARTQQEAGFWQLINIILPLALLLLFGWVYNWIRRRRYAR